MATVTYSSRALEHLERDLGSFRDAEPDAAVAAAAAIRTAVASLVSHPLLGRRLQGEIRELVISYGRTGYIALYRFVVQKDVVRILAVRRQREIGFVP